MNVEGIAKNIFNIIDASYYLGKDAQVTSNSDARGGQYAKVFGPNQIILDTGWSTMNAWVGLHDVTIRWFSDIAANDDGVVVEYWKMDTEGVESLALSLNCAWNTYNSDEFGNAVGLRYFTENYQYRIIVKSAPNVLQNQFVAVDFLRILPIDNHLVYSPFIYGVTSDEGAAATQMNYPEIYTVTGDGSSSYYLKTVDFPTDFDVEFAVPVATIYSSRLHEVCIESITDTNFVLNVMHKNGTNWSGGVQVTCHLGFFPIIRRL